MKALSKDYLLFDFGDDLIKLLAVSADKQKLEVFPSYPQDPIKRRNSKILAAIKNYLDSNNILIKSAAICISAKEAYIRRINLSAEKSKIIESQVIQYLEEHCPFPVNSACIAHKVLQSTETSTTILIAAIPLYVSDRYRSLLEDLGLVLEILTLSPLSLYHLGNSLVGAADKDVLFLDLGATKTDIYTTHHAQFSLSRSLPLGSNAFSKELEEYYQITYEEAEQLMHSINYAAASESTPFAAGKKTPFEVIDPLLETLVTDIQRSIGYHINQEINAPIDLIYLCGGNTNLPGLQNILETELGIPVLPYPLQNSFWDNLGLSDLITDKTKTSEKYYQLIPLLSLLHALLTDRVFNLLPALPEKSELTFALDLVTRIQGSIGNYIPGFLKLPEAASVTNTSRKNDWLLRGSGLLLLLAIAYFCYLQAEIIYGNKQSEQNTKQIIALAQKAEKLEGTDSLSLQSESALFAVRPPQGNPLSTPIAEILMTAEKAKIINFNKIEFNSGDLNIYGTAKNGSSLAEFIKTLQTTKAVRNADIVLVTQRENLVEFQLAIKTSPVPKEVL